MMGGMAHKWYLRVIHVPTWFEPILRKIGTRKIWRFRVTFRRVDEG